MTPTSVDDVAAALAAARAEGRTLTPVGGGTRSRCGRVIDGDAPLPVGAIAGIVEHIPAELTVTVRAGTAVSDLADHLAAAGQWWPQADGRPGSTVGGVISAGASGRRRLRHGPVRDSLLEVVLVTGDGRVVRGGGPTVKGVAGYDIPRLMVGARGTLGIITQVTLKLTPLPAVRRWFRLDGSLAACLAAARELVGDPRRPGALLLTPGALHVELAGVAQDVVAPPGFVAADEPTGPDGNALVDVGVPPARIGELIGYLEDRAFPYEAQFGVGAVRVALRDPADLTPVRAWAGARGGHAVVADAPPEYRADPWGRMPGGLGIMRRMYTAFDPHGTLSPGHRLGAA